MATEGLQFEEQAGDLPLGLVGAPAFGLGSLSLGLGSLSLGLGSLSLGLGSFGGGREPPTRQGIMETKLGAGPLQVQSQGLAGQSPFDSPRSDRTGPRSVDSPAWRA